MEKCCIVYLNIINNGDLKGSRTAVAVAMHFVKEVILVVFNDEDEDGDGDVEGSHYDDYGGIMEGRDGSKHGHCPLGLRAT